MTKALIKLIELLDREEVKFDKEDFLDAVELIKQLEDSELDLEFIQPLINVPEDFMIPAIEQARNIFLHEFDDWDSLTDWQDWEDYDPEMGIFNEV